MDEFTQRLIEKSRARFVQSCVDGLPAETSNLSRSLVRVNAEYWARQTITETTINNRRRTHGR